MKKSLLIISVFLSISIRISFAQCHAAYTYIYTQPGWVDFLDSSYGTTGSLTYSWTFGANIVGSSIPNPHIFYQYNGIYNVCLTIHDSAGCADSICMPVHVSNHTPVLSSYIDFDSTILYCTYPDTIPIYYFVFASNFPNSDSIYAVTINFDDGTDTVVYVAAYDTLAGSGQVLHVFQNAGSYTPTMIVTAQNLMTDTNIPPFRIDIFANCGPLTGTVYNDLNSNCTNDPGEELGGISLLIYNGTQFIAATNTDATGAYSFNVPVGPNYDIHVNASNGYLTHFIPSCPPSGIITASIPSSGNDFGVICPNGIDLTGSVFGWNFRPGFTGTVCVSAFNRYCNTPSGQIDIIFPADVTPLPDTNGIGYTISGDTVIYPISSSGLSWSFCIPVSVSLAAQIGDTACIGMILLPIAGDSVPSDNTITYCKAITGSFDPNDKYVTPAGDGAQGYILPNTPLTYTIHFQNTGNADAINIFILDTLSSNLDAASVEIIGSSHNVSMSLLTGNILRFNFDNINLADSNSNEPASHGYVTYKINQVNAIAQGAVINNSAGIYFDFNQPVITNTTVNTIDYFLSVPVINNKSSLTNIYPNPSNDKCHLFFINDHPRIISVSDLLGNEIFRSRSTSDSFILNTLNFRDGIYTIQLYEDNDQINSSKLVIVH